MGRFTKSWPPFVLDFWVRVSLVWSPTIVTVVSGKTPPVLSVTVPTIPPSVCAWALGAKAVEIHNDVATKKNMNLVLLSVVLMSIGDLVGICRYTRALTAIQPSYPLANVDRLLQQK